ncbi:antitoxin [Benzoatithermus flavus]|uniref:SpoVT-AbrB domain-containing protein n=1 Tax=Benzoatithermus flavus TaxID=3108223 RepID=A0ABU8XKQ2_9PROT
MATAKVFRFGDSRAVRLPKEFRLSSGEVEIFRRGDGIVPREKSRDLGRAFDLLRALPDDVPTERRDDPPRLRHGRKARPAGPGSARARSSAAG